jgi:hypothetical protein
MGRSATPRQWETFIVFLFALFPASNALQPKMDEDTWWHLAVGEYVVRHGAVPTHDPFSRISQEEPIPWVAYSWLHEVTIYGVYQLGGLNGILVFRHVLDSLMYLTIVWFTLRHANGRIQPLIVLALVTATLVPMLLERPWHYTIILTTLTLHATIELRGGASVRRFWWLLPAFALWANLHIQFVLGFGVLGLGLVATAVERWRVGRPINVGPRAGLIAACMAATLINPYHVRLYFVIWEYASQTIAMRLVSELAPPDFSFQQKHWWNWALVAILLWAAVACSRRRLPIFDVAILIVGALFSLRMQRDIWFGSLCAAAVLTRLSGGERTANDRWQVARLGVAIVVAVLVARAVWIGVPGVGKSAEIANRNAFPAGAVEYIREHRPPGPLFNHFDWGGYLIWKLPEYPVSIDGRTNLYGEQRLVRSYKTWAGDPSWESDPELLAAGFIIAQNKERVKLTNLLRSASDRWRIVYEDDVAVVFVPVAKQRSD